MKQRQQKIRTPPPTDDAIATYRDNSDEYHTVADRLAEPDRIKGILIAQQLRQIAIHLDDGKVKGEIHQGERLIGFWDWEPVDPTATALEGTEAIANVLAEVDPKTGRNPHW